MYSKQVSTVISMVFRIKFSTWVGGVSNDGDWRAVTPDWHLRKGLLEDLKTQTFVIITPRMILMTMLNRKQSFFLFCI